MIVVLLVILAASSDRSQCNAAPGVSRRGDWRGNSAEAGIPPRRRPTKAQRVALRASAKVGRMEREQERESVIPGMQSVVGAMLHDALPASRPSADDKHVQKKTSARKDVSSEAGPSEEGTEKGGEKSEWARDSSAKPDGSSAWPSDSSAVDLQDARTNLGPAVADGVGKRGGENGGVSQSAEYWYGLSVNRIELFSVF